MIRTPLQTPLAIINRVAILARNLFAPPDPKLAYNRISTPLPDERPVWVASCLVRLTALLAIC